MAWFALLAEFSSDPDGTDGPGADRRSTGRRRLAFGSLLAGARPSTEVVVLDLSQEGMMLHAPDRLAVGETFEVVLPEAGAVEARVVWKRTSLYGCRFLSPVSRGTISAILLRAAPGPSISTGC